MNLQNLYFITEIIGGVAIVASLIFVALQVRQNTEAMRAAALERHADHYKMLNLPIVENADFADILVRGMRDIDSLDEAERLRFIAHITMSLRGWETMFLVHSRGALDDELWEASSETFKSVVGTHGMQTYWRLRRFSFCRRFQDYVDKLMEQGGVRPLYRESERNSSERQETGP